MNWRPDPDPARYPACIRLDLTGTRYRYRVTVAEWDARPDALIDTSAFLYAPDAEAMGLECWRAVDGVDAHRAGGLFDVWLASGSCVTQTGTQFLYVSESSLVALRGLPTAGSAS